MLAAEVVKIIWAIMLEENPSELIDVYALSYNPNMHELIRNLRSKWFQDYDLKMISSFHAFLREFSKRYDLDQDEKRKIENADKWTGFDNLKELLRIVAKHLRKNKDFRIVSFISFFCRIFSRNSFYSKDLRSTA